MSTTEDPVNVADRVALAMSTLKVSTEKLDNPADALWIIGSIQAASISLMLTLRHLSVGLQNHVTVADLGSGPTTASRANAMRAAERLDAAAREHTATFAALVKASESLSRVEWDPDAHPELDDCRPVTTVTTVRPHAEIRSNAIGPTL